VAILRKFYPFETDKPRNPLITSANDQITREISVDFGNSLFLESVVAQIRRKKSAKWTKSEIIWVYLDAQIKHD